MRLKDKVALVTGAGTGIGRAIAERFAAEGARVAVNYRPSEDKENEEEARAVVASLATPGLAVGADVSKRDEVERMASEVVEKFGRLDIAVCNAGMEIKRPFLEVTDEEWGRVMGVNLYGAFVVSQAAARLMVSQGSGGKLIYTSSVHEDIPFPGYTSYGCVANIE